MSPALRSAFAALFSSPARDCLLTHLSRTIGPTSTINAEDALHLAAESLWRRPAPMCRVWDQGGAPALRRLVFVAARRQIRRRARHGAARFERCISPPAEASHGDTPERMLVRHRLARDIPSLARAAALTYGGSRVEQLEQALYARVFSGESETELARQFGVRRDLLNRAHRWLRVHLEQHPDAELSAPQAA